MDTKFWQPFSLGVGMQSIFAMLMNDAGLCVILVLLGLLNIFLYDLEKDTTPKTNYKIEDEYGWTNFKSRN